MLCPVCKKTQIVEISMVVGHRRVFMHNCSFCETRWWDDADGNPVPLGRVLELAGQTGRRRRA